MAVERINWYVERYRTLGGDKFRLEFPFPVLLARENQETQTEGSFHTAFMSRGSLDSILRDAAGRSQPPESAASVGIRAGEVRLIRKAEGAAFAQRIGVGRARNADVYLPNPKVSKYHAFFQLGEDGGYTLTDAGSRNGTWVEDQRLTEREPAHLTNGDRVTFGPHRFLYYSPAGFLETVHLRAARE